MDQFRGLISFDIVKPDKILKFFDENLSFDSMMGFDQKDRMSASEESS